MTVIERKTAWGNWENCYQISNGLVDLVITLDVGPRVIRFGYTDGENCFKVYDEQLGKTGGDSWRIYGGHRLWHAPEHTFRTYYPDNSPVEVSSTDGTVKFTPPTEITTHIQKTIEITLHPSQAQVTVKHRLENVGAWDVTLAPWALSVMAPGGVAVLPLPPRGKHATDLLPTGGLSLWSYTQMNDPRWTWGGQYILLRSNTEGTPQKIGAVAPDGWLAYIRDGVMFVKRAAYDASGQYPDNNSNVELFTNDEMLELETLGHMTSLVPGGVVEHTETWSLHRDLPAITSDADVTAHVLPRI